MTYIANPASIVERLESLQVLKRIDQELYEAMTEDKSYTTGGRLNRSALARRMSITPNQLTRRLDYFRGIAFSKFQIED